MEQKKKIQLPAARAAVQAYRCQDAQKQKEPSPVAATDPLGMYTGLVADTPTERPTQDADDL